MKRINLYFVLGTAVLAALAVAACARDRSGPVSATDPAVRITADVTEGARVRATVRDVVSVPGATATEVETGVAAAEAVVRSGRALDPASGAFLAATDRNGVDDERDFEYTDDGGHRHRLVLHGMPGHGPIASARYEEDGELVAEVAWRWESRGGGWVLRERSLTLHHHGREMLRQVRHADAVDVTPSGAIAEDAFLPPVQRMQAVEVACGREWALYIGASTTLILTGEVYTLAPTPATLGALVTAIGAWETAFNNLLNCQLRAAGAIG
jgi:hypothetical protein